MSLSISRSVRISLIFSIDQFPSGYYALFEPFSDETILPGGDWAGNADVYASSGCPSTCVGVFRDFQKLHVVE